MLLKGTITSHIIENLSELSWLVLSDGSSLEKAHDWVAPFHSHYKCNPGIKRALSSLFNAYISLIFNEHEWGLITPLGVILMHIVTIHSVPS